MPPDRQVLIIGGGIAGLTAALSLSKLNIQSVIVEQTGQLGGFAADYACKATDACVSCGACIVHTKIKQVVDDPRIKVYTDSRIDQVDQSHRFRATIRQNFSSKRPRMRECKVHAAIIASGFTPFDPQRMPYGYKTFPNVITNLDLERMLRRNSLPECPSDGRTPQRMAFVQCVGSRDAKRGHLWCSKVCCPSALRMARLIQMRQPDTEVVFFYIDVQTFGKTFQTFYEDVKSELRMIRTIPGEVYHTPEDRLRVIFYDPAATESREELFDMLVLSVSMTPSAESRHAAAIFGLAPEESGFITTAGKPAAAAVPGVFAAGSATGPMNIAESMASADRAAMEAALFLERPAIQTHKI